MQLLLSTKPKLVLDAGCGDGYVSSLIQLSTGAEVFALDVSFGAIESARSKGIKARQLDISSEEFPFEGATFDAVYATEVLEHLLDPDFAVTEMNRVLKPGGALVVSTPNLGAWYNRIALLAGYQPFSVETSSKLNFGRAVRSNSQPVGHIRSFTLRALRQLLTYNGFSIQQICGSHFDHAPLRTLDKLLSSIPSLASDLIILARKM
jgi:SAM-dependent methyltransferase